MEKTIELDYALSSLQLNNQTVTGLLAVLTDTLDIICQPISNGKQALTKEQADLIVYELLRDKKSIDALLKSLKHFINDQDKQLTDIYKQFITQKGE